MKTPLLFSAIISALVAPALLMAQPVVSNLAVSQRAEGDRAVDISYDLSGASSPVRVSILVSNDNGLTYAITPRTQYLVGDVGGGFLNGTGYAIVWDAMADVPEIFWPETRVRVIATEESASDPETLAITSTLAAGSVSQTQSQTLAFVFESPVTGFTASDIIVTGATKGLFIGAGSTYTLAITATGGKVEVSVPRNAASPGNNPATFSNFYQDTWTLILPGNVPMELVRIPAGTFTMGSPLYELSRRSDEFQHEVTISEDYYLGKTEVTQQQWRAVSGSWPPPDRGSAQNGVGDNLPAYHIGYNDAQAFLQNLNSVITEPGTFSLPTEAQWEYACRAGTTTRFNFGDGFSQDDEGCGFGPDLVENMWYCGNRVPSGPFPALAQLVAQKPANGWGLHDMHGNAPEWCADWYGVYPLGSVIDPVGPSSGSLRIKRGGHWGDEAMKCRSARRNFTSPDEWFGAGVRVLAVR